MNGTDWVITIAGIGWLGVFFATFVFSANAISWKLTEADRQSELHNREVDLISTFNVFPPYW